jgi:hypothetical protein
LQPRGSARRDSRCDLGAMQRIAYFRRVASPFPSDSRKRRVVKRLAQVSVLFFLLKGLGWLVVGWLAWKGLS